MPSKGFVCKSSVCLFCPVCVNLENCLKNVTLPRLTIQDPKGVLILNFCSAKKTVLVQCQSTDTPPKISNYKVDVPGVDQSKAGANTHYLKEDACNSATGVPAALFEDPLGGVLQTKIECLASSLGGRAVNTRDSPVTLQYFCAKTPPDFSKADFKSTTLKPWDKKSSTVSDFSDANCDNMVILAMFD